MLLESYANVNNVGLNEILKTVILIAKTYKDLVEVSFKELLLMNI